MAATLRTNWNTGKITISADSAEDLLMAVADYTRRKYAITRPLLTSPNLLKAYLKAHVMPQTLEQEEFHVLYLNTQNELITHEVPFKGTVDSCAVHCREIVKKALQHNAAACIFAHNHPSGNPEPSPADRQITDRLKSALALIDVRVLDHIVLGHTDCTSLAERGWV